MGWLTSPACDTDGDGIADYVDTDSDGDLCPDAVEAGIVAQGATITNGSITDNSGQVDGNGVPNVAITRSAYYFFSKTVHLRMNVMI